MIRNIFRKSISFSIKKQLSVLLLLIVTTSYKSIAQNSHSSQSIQSKQFYKVISFGDKIDFGNIDSSVTWTIKSSNKNINTTINSDEINNYVFQEPGEYEIKFNENKKHNDECHHTMFAETFFIKVEPVKLSFDFSKIEFSEKIEKGKTYSDLIITVPVKITTKNNSITKLPAPGMSVSGVGVLLNAEPLQNEIILNSKSELLKYKISGMVNKETYLMFDFYDFNNQVQTYNLPEIIK